MSKESEGQATQAKGGAFSSKKTGWATMESTSAFRAINFELFVRPVSMVFCFNLQKPSHDIGKKMGGCVRLVCAGYRLNSTGTDGWRVPSENADDTNKFVMAVGAAAFLASVGYIFYMNMDRDKKKTYVTLNEDGSLSSRPVVSRWD
ncbi:hypothetical protein BaRGS_00037502 [Batillaria attramentaria]|uniref:Small integral membrane protein 8 n=1 Tax=Batillaria attramentaria TaxID=370345 RepID=A0ABD0J8R4_9CAEN